MPEKNITFCKYAKATNNYNLVFVNVLPYIKNVSSCLNYDNIDCLWFKFKRYTKILTFYRYYYGNLAYSSEIFFYAYPSAYL